MKNSILMLAATLALMLTACHKENLQTQTESVSTEVVTPDGVTDRTGPVISSISATSGYWWCGSNDWSSYKKADLDNNSPSIFTISGSGFGSTQGSVSILNATGYSVSITSWSASSIKVRIKPTSTGSVQKTGVQLKVIISGGQNTTSGAFNLVPYAYTRQFKQCTWWATIRRIDTGATPQAAGQSYSNYTGSINANYEPAAKDIMIWHNSHQAFVESVSTVNTYNPPGQPSGTIDYTYTMTISQYNIACESYSTFTKVVKVRKAPNGTRTIISGNYNHPVTGLLATNYFR